MFDSGVRTPADAFKALALVAKFAFLGRLWVWALSIAGEHDVRRVMNSFLAEFDLLMEEAGFQSIDPIDRSAIDSLPNTSNLILSMAASK